MGCFPSFKNSNQVANIESVTHLKAGNMPYMTDNRPVGKGLKSTYAWETGWCAEDVMKKQEMFWKERVDGNPAIWAALKQILEEFDEIRCNQLIDMHGLKIVKGITVTEDGSGFMYYLPYYVMSAPTRCGMVKNQTIYPDELMIMFRTPGNREIPMKVETNEQFDKIREKIAKIIERDAKELVVKIDGAVIDGNATPQSINLSRTTIIEIVSKHK